jgi:sarcosine oxidase subunit alpha
MSRSVCVYVDGEPVAVPDGANVAAAVARVAHRFRTSPGGMPRAPLCGMGVCFECRVQVNGHPCVIACMTPARDGMRVQTDG